VTVESPAPLPLKLSSIQALRAVAALMVLLYHLVNTSAFGWNTSDGKLYSLGALISAIGPAGVDLFFVISGVVMVLTCYDRFGSAHESARFLRRRVARIYPLYWVVTAGVLAICWIRPELATRDKFAWPSIVKSLLLWPQSEYPIVAVGWTLSYEMFFYLVFAVLLMMPRRWLAPALAVWAASIIVLFQLHVDPAMKLASDGHLALPLYASPLALEFIAGCGIALLVRRNITALAGTSLALGIAGLVVAGSYIGMHSPEEAHFGMLRAAVFGGSSALIVYGCIARERQGRASPGPALVFWGDASYAMYLTHMYVLWLIAAVLSTPSSSAMGVGVRTAIGIAACAVAAALCHLTFERPLLRWLQGSPAPVPALPGDPVSPFPPARSNPRP
jgi:exopolysaccharide production protein ExoZ